MKWLIVGLFLFSAFLFFMYIFQVLFLSNKRMEKRLKHYLATNDRRILDRKNLNVFVQISQYNQKLREQMLSKKKNQKLISFLQQSGLPIKPEEYIMFRWMSTLLCAGLLYLFSGSFFFIFVGAILGYLVPQWWVKKKKKQRITKFNDGLPDMISTVIGSLRAGFSFAQALKTVSEEADSPIKEEIEFVLKEMQYGNTLDDALQELKERMPSEDLELMIQAILIQKQVGGNLATVLDTIVQTIRDRIKIQRQIVTLTAQGRLSGVVIGLLPVIVGVLIYFIEPEYISILFTHPLGLMLLGVGVFSGTLGFIFIRKLTMIEV
jgi:tight adherence protein B